MDLTEAFNRYHYSLDAMPNDPDIYDEVDLHFACLVDDLPLQAIYMAFCTESQILGIVIGEGK